MCLHVRVRSQHTVCVCVYQSKQTITHTYIYTYTYIYIYIYITHIHIQEWGDGFFYTHFYQTWKLPLSRANQHFISHMNDFFMRKSWPLSDTTICSIGHVSRSKQLEDTENSSNAICISLAYCNIMFNCMCMTTSINIRSVALRTAALTNGLAKT